MGPEVGYEAVGILDKNLMTFSIWAKAGLHDSPKDAKTDDETSARNLSDPLHYKDSSEHSIDLLTQSSETFSSSASKKSSQQSAEQKHYDASVVAPARKSEYYGKGVVFYTKEKTIVGILLFNLFNRASLARKIISDKKTVDEIDDLVELFDIHGEDE